MKKQKPTKDNPKTFQRLALHTAIATAMLSGAYGRQAYAGTCIEAPTNFVCANPADAENDVTQNLTATDLQVLTENGFGIDTNTGNAFTLTGNGNLVFTDEFLSAITGQESAIVANNDGPGAITITTTGTVTSREGYGILAENSANGTDLTITANAVISNSSNNGDDAINARNYGTGNTRVTTTGNVYSASGDGIFVRDGEESGDIVIETADVSGHYDGIDISHNGVGTLTVTATGTVVGRTDRGLELDNDASGLGITANVVDVYGDDDGIYIANNGFGDIRITATGSVTGNTGDGIYADTDNYGGDIIVTVVDVFGGDDGIAVEQEGTGSAIITATGTITGESDHGIRAFVGGPGAEFTSTGNDLRINAVSVYGADNAVDAVQYGSGSVSITTTGNVESSAGHGISAIADANNQNMVISANNVTGFNSGIVAKNDGAGVLSITATGTVIGSNVIAQEEAPEEEIVESGDGIYAYSGANTTGLDITVVDVQGADDGIQAEHNGSGILSITSTGTVSGAGDFGIDARNTERGSDLIINVASVSGNDDGIQVDNFGTGRTDITSTGLVSSTTGDGIEADSRSLGTDMAISVVDVYGYDIGIDADHDGTGSLTITATGTVTSANFHAIDARTSSIGTDLIINVASVYGDNDALQLDNNGTGITQVTATGQLFGVYGDGVEADNVTASGAMTINVVDAYGRQSAIDADHDGSGALTITATGALSSVTDHVIRAYNSNNGTDLIIAANTVRALEDLEYGGVQHAIRAENYGSGLLSITTTGEVSSETGNGIDAYNAEYSTDLIINTASVTGALSGIEARHYGSGSLAVTSTGTVTGTSNYGIGAANYEGTSLTIVAENAVGGKHGIGALHFGSGNLSVTSSGDLTGGELGIGVENFGTGDLLITSTGSVTGGDDGIGATNDVTAAAATITVADVTGGNHGINLLHDGSGDVTINTTGTVTAQDGYALFLNRNADSPVGGNITNSGNLVSETDAAVLLGSGFDFNGRFTNQGNITGGDGVAIDASANTEAMAFQQQSGTITGDILLGSGDDLFTISGGAIDGEIIGQGNGEVVVDLGADGVFTSQGIENVRDYTIRSGRVNQAGDFSTAGTTTTIERDATMAFASEINGSGALVSDGNLAFVLGEGSAGKLVQTGTVTLNNGSTITVEGNGQFDFDSRFELIEATDLVDNGVVVQDSDSLLFDLNFDVEAGTAAITTEVADLGAISNLDNAAAFGDAIAAQANLDRNFDNPAVALLATLNDGDVRGFEEVADSFSPSVSGAVTNASLALNTVRQEQLNARLVQRTDVLSNTPSQGVWGSMSVGSNSQDGDDQVQGFDAETTASAFGFDHQMGAWKAGVAVNQLNIEADNDRFARDRIETDITELSLYGGWAKGAWQAQASLALASLDYEFERVSLVPGENQITADTEGQQFSLGAQVSYDLPLSDKLLFQPFAGLNYSSLSVDDFVEQGGLNQNVAYDDIDTFTSDIGVAARFANVAIGNSWRLVSSAQVKWSHDWMAEQETATASFAQQSYQQVGIERDADLFNLGLGLSVYNFDGLTFNLNYDGGFSDSSSQNKVTLGVDYRF